MIFLKKQIEKKDESQGNSVTLDVRRFFFPWFREKKVSVKGRDRSGESLEIDMFQSENQRSCLIFRELEAE